MTQEEKAKRYDEALERAKEQLNGAKVFDYDNEQIAHDIRTTVYNIFPQLKESEDERIRKELIGFIKGQDKVSSLETSVYQSWLAWLESLFPQKQWKPSDEQMEALVRCVDYLEDSDNEDLLVMESLLEQLKELC